MKTSKFIFYYLKNNKEKRFFESAYTPTYVSNTFTYFCKKSNVTKNNILINKKNDVVYYKNGRSFNKF